MSNYMLLLFLLNSMSRARSLEKAAINVQYFTLSELEKYNGIDGSPAYVAISGIVYDVSNEKSWINGSHYGLTAGKDLTQQIKQCHMNVEMIIKKLKIIGYLKQEIQSAMDCPILNSKNQTALKMTEMAYKKLEESKVQKPNLIWLEANGCSGNIISLLNANNPDVSEFLTKIVTMKYSNSLMAAEGEKAFEEFLNTLSTNYILVVEGAISTKNNGLYNVIANYKGKPVTAMEAVKMAAEKANYILAVGTCASFGGISKASPNPSGCASLDEFLDRKDIIKIPGCPGHPDWVIGTIAHLIAFGKPELDDKSRPIIFYGISIHDRCSRRSYFDKGIFAENLGDKTCMIKLGCKGPVTKTDCPIRQWNNHANWPVEDNTPCIGCAQEGFPDGMEPFIKY